MSKCGMLIFIITMVVVCITTSIKDIKELDEELINDDDEI